MELGSLPSSSDDENNIKMPGNDFSGEIEDLSEEGDGFDGHPALTQKKK